MQKNRQAFTYLLYNAIKLASFLFFRAGGRCGGRTGGFFYFISWNSLKHLQRIFATLQRLVFWVWVNSPLLQHLSND